MSNVYGQGMPYGIPQTLQSPPPSDQSNKSRQSQQRNNSLRKNPPNNFSRGPAGNRQQWPLSNPVDQRDSQPTASASSIPRYSGNAPRAPSSVYSGAGVWSEDGYNSMTFPSPNPSRPITGASLASTSSSYSLPDALPPFAPQALPSMQLAPPQQGSNMAGANSRIRAPLGPPPSSRRGPSSYYPQYPQQAYVSPIVEESDSQRNSDRGSLRPGDESRGSYASSNAIPIGVPDYYLNRNGVGRENIDSYVSEYDEPEFPTPPRAAAVPRQESPPALVRQASLGKRSKPTLTTIKPGDNPKPVPGHQRAYSDESAYEENLQTLPPVSQSLSAGEKRPTLAKAQYSDDSRGNESRRTDSSDPLGKNESTFLERSSSESDTSDFMKYKMKDYNGEFVPTARKQSTSNDPRVESILNRLEKGGALPTSDEKTSSNQQTSLAQRVGSKRPPRIDVDAVREAEQRGSLTSLPDLIRRATKLASNLDRGKTASRLGFDWMLSSDEKAKAGDKRRSGSLSDMISAFPPPAAVGTPVSRGSGRFAWPSHLRNEMTDNDNDPRDRATKPKRRCCGMPLWAFLLLMLLLILLIAAAVIVPVFLIVVPHQSSESQARSMASCQQSLTCANGGSNIIGANGSCRCLCLNGFTGATCSIASGPNCTTTSVLDGKEATVGDSVPRLLEASQTNFSIPLYGDQIVSLLSSANLSCSSENSLVSFGGISARSVDLSFSDLEVAKKPTRTLHGRQVTTTMSAQAVATSDGIVYASGSPPPMASSTSTASVSASELDFARVAVLFVLQDSGQLNNAISAQTALEKSLSAASSSGNVTLQNGYSADLGAFRIAVKNGTVFGKA
ncbi:hypothetical protein K461DRAFT_177368 [Myriangium duriaei CBS 260.36]|uniref:EGF-like domain-containing protein n=1 Tax=Myriangium duriaei CBS 260.36 TaxID=1168546 RepID=A0A9P4MI01_9PEZI|nr:hypothetical protein K461DRAFT_177368 [Myriangium duriaei CBS 260.36]